MEKMEKSKRVILLTQQLGVFTPEGVLEGRDSTAKIDRLLKQKGCDVLQLKITDCSIRNGKLIHKNSDVDSVVNIEAYGSVIKRSWDGGINANHGTDLQRFLESKGLYADNPATAQDITHNRFKMQSVLESVKGLKTPATFTIRSSADIKPALSILKLKHEFKPNSANYPAFVVKGIQGTHGNGLLFYTMQERAELEAKLETATEENPIILQEFIKGTLISGVNTGDSIKNAAHQRVIISRSGKDKPYEYIGGLYFQRNGAWISNSHAKEGTPHKRSLEQPDENNLELLGNAASEIGLNQAGIDVIKSVDGGYYVLEYNDSMGVTGELLEKNGVTEKYVDSFLARAKEHYQNKNLDHKTSVQLSRNDKSSKSQLSR